MTVAVTGSMAFDYIMSFPGKFAEHILPEQIEKLSVSFLVDSMRRERGGTAGNIAYSLALLGQPTLLMAAVGQDASGYIAQLEKVGVDTSGVLYSAGNFTASFFVSTDNMNNQIASFYIGAMADANRISFKDQNYKEIDIAIISPDDPVAMVNYVRECKELNIPYIYDPSQQIPRLASDDVADGIRGAKILIVNEYEFEMIKKQTGFSADEIKGMAETVIITLGEQGSVIYTVGREINIPPAKPERISDPTGVGDAYRAGLITGIMRKYPWEVSARLASVSAVYVLEQHGTQTHHYTCKELASRYRDTFGYAEQLENFIN